MKTSDEKKISWPDRIDLFKNVMLVVIVSIIMAVLAFVANKML